MDGERAELSRPGSFIIRILRVRKAMGSVIYPHIMFLGSFGVMAKAFLPPVKKMDELVERMSDLASIARKDGMMALEGQDVPDKFFQKGLQMLVDGAEPVAAEAVRAAVVHGLLDVTRGTGRDHGAFDSAFVGVEFVSAQANRKRSAVCVSVDVLSGVVC